MRTFIGLKDFSGWRFTLTPATNEAGSPGFTRETLTPRDGWAADLARTTIEANVALYSSEVIRALRSDLEAGRPPADWVEDEWLTQWLRGGLIKEVSDA